MDKGIGLLIDGSKADLQAVYCAIQVAERVGRPVHVLIAAPERYETMVSLAVRLADSVSVNIDCHLIEGDFDETLAAFLTETGVSCLVVGAGDETAEKEKMRWARELRERLAKDQRWYASTFRTFVVRPWDHETFERVLRTMNPVFGTEGGPRKEIGEKGGRDT